MEQRIVTLFTPFKKEGATNFDSQVMQLLNSGYVIKQIVSSSLSANNINSIIMTPTLAVTILLEKKFRPLHSQ